MNKTVLKNYAKLLAVKGLCVRRGDEVIIQAELDQPEFVEMVVRECREGQRGVVAPASAEDAR